MVIASRQYRIFCQVITTTIFLSSWCIAQFSPGELSRAHQQLDGTMNCTKCHEVGKEISGKNCLGCHETIRTSLEKRRGFHFASSAHPCVSCHKEHLGRDAKTYQFDPKTFDHGKTGFHLAGKHSSVRCEQCHQQKNVIDQITLKAMSAHSRQTYLGLGTECNDCHKDPHAGKFNDRACASCHSTDGWKAIHSFDHSITRFRLDGKHEKIECSKCHTSMTSADPKNRFATQPFSDCTPCHSTPHKSIATDNSCRSCHETTGWQKAINRPYTHTRFKLIGKHRELGCMKCHPDRGSFERSFLLSFASCMDCHTDKHNGEFRQSYKNDCALCHSESGFRPAKFTLVQHQTSRFRLEGSHQAVLCGQCHREERGKLTFHFADLQCIGCHEDTHSGQFASLMKEKSCDACHNPTDWKQTTYNHKALTDFALTGKHALISCASCHTEVQSAKGKPLQFKKLPKDCESCHKDPHGTQFTIDGKTGCARCHTAEEWKRLSFDHEKQSAFALTGAHRNVPCHSCHKEEMIGISKVVRYKPLASKCESCHTEVKR